MLSGLLNSSHGEECGPDVDTLRGDGGVSLMQEEQEGDGVSAQGYPRTRIGGEDEQNRQRGRPGFPRTCE